MSRFTGKFTSRFIGRFKCRFISRFSNRFIGRFINRFIIKFTGRFRIRFTSRYTKFKIPNYIKNTSEIKRKSLEYLFKSILSVFIKYYMLFCMEEFEKNVGSFE